MPRQASAQRTALIAAVAVWVAALGLDRIRVAVDGLTGAGKTSFGHELAAVLRSLGRATMRASMDDRFCQTCVIDGVLQHSPAEHVRRPAVPAESPIPGFTHLQFEAMLTAARDSANPHDFTPVAMLGLPDSGHYRPA